MSSPPSSALPAPAAPLAAAAPWTCPFCSLHCDGYGLAAEGDAWRLQGSDCPRAQAALQHFSPQPDSATPRIDGQPASLPAALDAAAQRLRRARQPLLGGLAADVAAQRMLYRVAARLNAITDHAHGDALTHAVRAQQDRGVVYATLSELRNRADLLVCVGTQPAEHYPEFFRRAGVTGEQPQGLPPSRHVVFLGAPADAAVAQAGAHVTHEVLPLQGDLFETVAVLNALVARKTVTRAEPALVALAERLLQAQYAVLVWEAGRLPAQGALVAEGLWRLVNTLNQVTRAAAFALGGSDGAYSAHQTITWLSGLPLRTHVGPAGLDHDPLRYGTQRLLDAQAIDALLWVAAFTPGLAPPAHTLPQVVLGHPRLQLRERDSVFIPVATPGIGSSGHLFRTDGGVVLPLHAARAETLPTVADVAAQLLQRLEAAA